MNTNKMREFAKGATRNSDEGKLDYEGFLAPEVLMVYASYMQSHRVQADGKLRDSDNWQKGIPKPVYMKSMWRHFMDVWRLHRGHAVLSPEDGHPVTMEEALCALLFNVNGYLFEQLHEKK